MFEIFKFEINQRIKSPLTWLYFLAVTFVSLFAIDFIYEGRLGPVKENAPYVIAVSMSVYSSFLMVICSLIMGMSVLKDYQHNIQSLIFVNPISKSGYLLGRFLGSFGAMLFIASGLFFGILLSEFLPWREASDMLPFNVLSYVFPFVYLIIPTLFFSSIIFFMSGALTRKLVVVYTQGILFLMLYLMSLVLSRGMGNQILLSQILDPFNFQTIKIIVKNWTINERNANQLIFTSYILYNRLVWISVGIISFVIGYKRFKFNAHLETKVKSKSLYNLDMNEVVAIDESEFVLPEVSIVNSYKSRFIQLWHVCKFQFFTILKEPLFITLLVSAILTVVINSIHLETKFGIDSYPLTYLIVEQLNELTLIFFLMILVFYSGEIIWKERDVKVSQITNSFPISDFVNITGKLSALFLVYSLLMVSLIFVGIVFQTLNIFFDYNIKVYLMSLVVQNLPFLIMYSIMSVFLQVLVNNKLLGYVLFMIFFLARIALDILGYGHVLYTFASGSLGMYSDMNGYGHTLTPFICFTLYWMAISILLLVLSYALSVRGGYLSLIKRIKLVRIRLTRLSISIIVVCLTVSFVLGLFIFYNTNVLNEFSFPNTENKMRAEYEKRYVEKAKLPQPKIIDVNLELDLYPEMRAYKAKGIYKLVNNDTIGIDEIIVQALPNSRIDLIDVAFDRMSTLAHLHDDYKLKIYKLENTLYPNDTLIMNFVQTYTSKGFVQDGNSDIVYNGTFFNNDHLPSIGYNDHIELEENNERKKFDLNIKNGFNQIDDTRMLRESTKGDDADFIDFEMIISTSIEQTTVAPGKLITARKSNNRAYFHYKMQSPMINFYDIVSAEYLVFEDQWVSQSQDSVDLEIYYHKDHNYNIDRMMNGMKSALDYYSSAFGEYQYDHARIMEIPRYKQFAQSYPGTIPFSESIGFVMNVNDSVDVDMPFFVTAHEVAHQWWGLKLLVADVEGHDFVLESLSQYSALMVLQKEFGKEKVNQFIKDEMKRYFQKRSWSKENEKPLSQVDDQEYVYYDKGAINLYALQAQIGEVAMNTAIRTFFEDWSISNVLDVKGRYATSLDLIKCFEDALPDSLTYLVEDLFEQVIFYNNRIDSVFIESQNDFFLIDVKFSLNKSRVDSSGNIQIEEVSECFDFAFYELKNGVEVLSKLVVKKLHLAETRVSFDLDFIPCKIVLDPNLKLLDKNLFDNEFQL